MPGIGVLRKHRQEDHSLRGQPGLQVPGDLGYIVRPLTHKTIKECCV